MRLNPVRVARSSVAIGSLGVGFAAGATAAAINGSRRSGANLMSVVGTELALAAAGVRLNVQGEENLWSHRPAIFVFNHQSQFDMPIMGALLRKDFTGVAKRSLQANPVFGPIGYLARVAFIDRSDPEAAREALEPVVKALKEGTSLAVAPEGTRSGTGALLPFKKGPFHLAIQAGVPLVPIAIKGSGRVLAPHSIHVRPGPVEVRVLSPVDITPFLPNNHLALRRNVHARIAAALGETAPTGAGSTAVGVGVR
jgi:putative phosphoserine phosphatase/1-acylglycerol-3-phosphate O-acyltransferase